MKTCDKEAEGIDDTDVDPVYMQLASKIEDADSYYAPRILERIVNVEETKLLLDLPATSEELSLKRGIDKQALDAILKELIRKGICIKTVSGKIKFLSHMVTIQDIAGANPKYDEERGEAFFELFKKFRLQSKYLSDVAESYLEINEGRPFTRVLPRWKAIKNIPGVMPCEDLREILKFYDGILSSSRCGCRLMVADRHCAVNVGTHADEGHCVHFGNYADYFVKDMDLGTYRSWQEMLSLLDELEKSPIYHCVGNLRDVHWLCNCCPCCCDINMPLARTPGINLKDALAPSRFLAILNGDKCTGCNICIGKCPFEAIDESGERKKVEINAKKCMGCGTCVINCPDNALKLKIVRPAEHIPEAGAQYLDGVIEVENWTTPESYFNPTVA
ncbi:MAG: 4Fe-4S binding protein [Deltaproteobacteria bacterium]|nr:4Fe-4S binding protein [Deltaproteobacteria bacterium]